MTSSHTIYYIKQIKMGLKWDAEDVLPYDLLHKINKTGEKMCGRGTDTLN